MHTCFSVGPLFQSQDQYNERTSFELTENSRHSTFDAAIQACRVFDIRIGAGCSCTIHSCQLPDKEAIWSTVEHTQIDCPAC